jgi:hypothetical protein
MAYKYSWGFDYKALIAASPFRPWLKVFPHFPLETGSLILSGNMHPAIDRLWKSAHRYELI